MRYLSGLGMDNVALHDHEMTALALSTLSATFGDQVRVIAETKLPDLNANDVDAAMKIIEGTARSMGVEVAE